MVEDLLSEYVLRRILDDLGKYNVISVYRKDGREYLKKVAPNFNKAAKSFAYLMLVDLDSDECAPNLIDRWLPHGLEHNFLLRVAIREVESWLLAAPKPLASFLQIPINKIPLQPDTLSDPKRDLVNLARFSKSKAIRDDLLPEAKSTSKVGKGYNSRLAQFVAENWHIETACQNSPSLARTYQRLSVFEKKNTSE